jgi:hypothetical protein
VRIERTRNGLDIQLWNPVGRIGVVRALRTGRGLVGIWERAELFGGSADAGPDEQGRWHLRVRLPTGTSR